MAVSIRRYEIPVDGKAHPFRLCYSPEYAMQGALTDQLYFFAEHDDHLKPDTLWLQVVGDGDPFPERALWLCMVPQRQAGKVWVIVQLPS